MTPTASRRSLLAGSAAVVCGLAGCLSGSRDVETSVTESYTATDLTALTVATEIGDIEVGTTAQNAIDVEGQKAALSREDLESIQLGTTTDDDVLELSVDRDESRSLFGLRPDPILDLSVAVPDEFEVRRIDTATGVVDVTGVAGDLTARTQSGAVALTDIDGTVSTMTETGNVTIDDPDSIDRIETETGDIEAALPDLEADASIETTTGAVDLQLPDQLDLTLEITTEAGEISVSDVENLPEMAGDSLIEAVVGDGSHRLEITTETGDVTVTGREN